MGRELVPSIMQLGRVNLMAAHIEPQRGICTGISIFNSDSPSHRHQGFSNAKFEPEFVPEGPFHYAPRGQLCLALA